MIRAFDDRSYDQCPVYWHGAAIGPDGNRGSLLPAYPSQSSWVLVERALRERLEFKLPRGSSRRGSDSEE